MEMNKNVTTELFFLRQNMSEGYHLVEFLLGIRGEAYSWHLENVGLR